MEEKKRRKRSRTNFQFRALQNSTTTTTTTTAAATTTTTAAATRTSIQSLVWPLSPNCQPLGDPLIEYSYGSKLLSKSPTMSDHWNKMEVIRFSHVSCAENTDCVVACLSAPSWWTDTLHWITSLVRGCPVCGLWESMTSLSSLSHPHPFPVLTPNSRSFIVKHAATHSEERLGVS